VPILRGGLPLFSELPRRDILGKWASGVRNSRKPIYRMVNGYALGPGLSAGSSSDRHSSKHNM